MARLSPFCPVLAFQAWLWPFWPVFGLSNTLYNLTICKIVICVQPSNSINLNYDIVCLNEMIDVIGINLNYDTFPF